MTDRLDAARTLRIGAERLRQIALGETDEDLASEMRCLATEMDENAGQLEGSFAGNPPAPPNDAAA